MNTENGGNTYITVLYVYVNISQPKRFTPLSMSTKRLLTLLSILSTSWFIVKYNHLTSLPKTLISSVLFHAETIHHLKSHN